MAKKKGSRGSKGPQKTTRKRATAEASESHQRRQERLEARRRAKEEALIAQQRRERRAKALRTTVFVAILVGAVYFLFLRQTSPTAIEGNEILTFSTSNGGTQTHTEPYNYTADTTGVAPPTSGNHDPAPAACGTHDQRIPDENLVHTLEHGAVGVLFDPKQVKQADIEDIEKIVGGYEDHTFSAPYQRMETPITVVSWSRKMPLDEMDSEAITEYIDTFRSTEPAPESGQACDNEQEDSFEIEESPSPEPSPPASPEPSPEPSPPAGDGGKEAGDDKSGPGGSKMEKEEEGN